MDNGNAGTTPRKILDKNHILPDVPGLSRVPRGGLLWVRAAAQQVVNGAVEKIRNGAESLGIGI